VDDLDVEIENNQLTVRGQQKEEKEKLYIHRGIAARQFQRSFVLADGIEILGASLDNGLLHIDMERYEPESTARKIEIDIPNKSSANKKNNNKMLQIETKD